MQSTPPFSPTLGRISDGTFSALNRVLGPNVPWKDTFPGASVALGWVMSRALMLLVLWFYEGPVINDLNYYFTNIHTASALGIGYAVPEYPLPVAALLALPYVLAFGNQVAYLYIFIGMMLLIDAAFTRVLYVQQGKHHTDPLTLWLAAGVLIGPLIVTRFDLVPGVLVALAVLWLSKAPVRSGIALAVGVGIKLWPLLVLPAFAAASKTRWRVITGSLVTAVVLITASLAIGGWERFISPLRYQSDRGLQIEAPISLPLMFAWAFHPGVWTVYFSDASKSVEVGGPGSNILLAASAVLTLASLATIALFALRAWRTQDTITPMTIAFISITSIGLIIMSNKVFSPQYLLWLTPTAIVTLALGSHVDRAETAAGSTGEDAAVSSNSTDSHRGLRQANTLLLLVALLTQIIYPRCYDWVSQLNPANPIGVMMLLIRDLGLAYVIYYFGRRAWAATRTSAHELSDTRSE